MECLNKYEVLKAGTRAKNGKVYNEPVMIRCGKCYACRMSRLRSWLFRLEREEQKSSSALFVTLTYGPKTIPISNNGFMTLKPKDVQTFYKRLRNQYRYKENGKWQYDKVPNIKHYTVGEYGGKGEKATGNGRPHYHALIFNAGEKEILNAWSIYGEEIGNVHFGKVNNKTIAYTLTYMIVKSAIEKKHARDDRIKEFSNMSKGIGKAYITDNVKNHHKNNLKKMYMLGNDNTKVAIPRYYRKLLFTEDEIVTQTQIVQKVLKEIAEKDTRTDEQINVQKQIYFKKIRIQKK